MKGYIRLLNGNLRNLPIEDVLTMNRDAISGLSVKYKDKWEKIDNYIHFDNHLCISWQYVTPNEWRMAEFLYQEGNKLFFDWDDSLLQNYFNILMHDLKKVMPLVDKNGLYMTNSELKEIIEQIKKLL